MPVLIIEQVCGPSHTKKLEDIKIEFFYVLSSFSQWWFWSRWSVSQNDIISRLLILSFQNTQRLIKNTPCVFQRRSSIKNNQWKLKNFAVAESPVLVTFKNNDRSWLSCSFTCTLQAFLLLCETERISLPFATSSSMKCLVVCEENNTCQACRSPLHKFAYKTQDHCTPCRVTASHSWHCTWNSIAKRAISFAESFKIINFVFFPF